MVIVSFRLVAESSPALIEALPADTLFVAEHVADRHRGVAQAEGLQQSSRLAVG
jgi:hypothetical protein